jgi:hypothetical protein
MVTVDIPEGDLNLFDIGSFPSFGCWIKITDSVGPSTIFSFGEYPSTWQALTIQNGNLIFRYNEILEFSVDITPYIGQWTWIFLYSQSSGLYVELYINGNVVASTVLGANSGINPLYIGSGNAPNTYFNGLMRDFVFDVLGTQTLGQFPPTEPLNTSTCLPVLLLFQGTDLSQQLTDNGIFGGVTITNSGAEYNTDSPYVGYEGSTKFGAPCS